MSELVANCPRCDSKKMTFDLHEANPRPFRGPDWQFLYETFCVCRECHRATTFVLQCNNVQLHDLVSTPAKLVALKGSVNSLFANLGFVSLKDLAGQAPPEHIPDDIEKIFSEASTCVAVGCYNAAATMFRLCLDLATRERLNAAVQAGTAEPNYKTRRDLGLRLPWLFDNLVLPEDLRDLSHSVKEDGNDGAHHGTVEVREVEDLLDFTRTLLERLYTEPKKVQLAKERRDARRAST